MALDADSIGTRQRGIEMRCTILLFGPEARDAGHRSVTVETAGSEPSCEQLRMALASEVPVLAERLPSCRFAVNQEFATDALVVKSGDEVALIGAVSGG